MLKKKDKDTLKKTDTAKAEDILKANLRPDEITILHSLLYRDGYRKIFPVMVLSIVLNLCLGAVIVLQQLTTGVEHVYFATDAKGKLVTIKPLNQRTPGDRAIANITAECISEAYTFSYKDYKKRVNTAINKCFTSQGGTQFKKVLKTSGIINNLLSTDGNVSLTISGSPSDADIKHGEQKGVSAWQVSIPVVVSREDLKSGKEYSYNYVAIITLVRTEGVTHEHGVGISQFILSPVKKS